MSVETEVVTISITQDTASVQRAGFGVPLVLSHNWTFSENLHYYESIDEVSQDGWSTTSPEYRAAQALFGQNGDKPERIAIGGSTDQPAPTLTYQIAAQAIRNNNTRAYKINVVGQGFVDAVAFYSTDGAATAAKIHAGLVASLNTTVGRNFTAAFAPLAFTDFAFTADAGTGQLTKTAHGLHTGDGPVRPTNTGGALPDGLISGVDYWVIALDVDHFQLAISLANALAGVPTPFTASGTGTQTLTHQAGTVSPTLPFVVAGNAPGNWFSLELVDATALTMALVHTGDPTALLDEIELAQPDWYCLLTNYNSTTYVQSTATWVQNHTKIYGFDVAETAAIQMPVSLGTDTLAVCHTAAFGRTFGSYHHRPATFMSAAWAGAVLPIDPGGETWALKPLAGVSMPSTLTATNRQNLRDRKANFCTRGFGKNVTFDGTTFDGDFIDVTRGLDWLNDDMTSGIGGVLTSVRKVPYTNGGVSTIVNEVEASLDRAVQRQILRANPKPVVTAPDVDSIDPATRGARLLPDIEFAGQLAGAIHKVGVKGLVSL